MLIATIIALLVGVGIFAFIVAKFLLMVILGIIGAVYFITFMGLTSVLGEDQIALSIFGALVIGTCILWAFARIADASETSTIHGTPDSPCPCGSGKQFRNCHGLR